MESRLIKFPSKKSNSLVMHAIPGHFATSSSHINYYIDVTSIGTRVAEAKQAAKIFSNKIPLGKIVDTIVCVDKTEMIGAFLGDELERKGILNRNLHETTYVVGPEINNQNQMIFRDNNKKAINGKHVVILLASTTTGDTLKRIIECIQYYGGIIEGICAIFSNINMIEGKEIDYLFDYDDIPGYEAFSVADCPFCKKGHKIEAMVNGFGYSKL